MLEMGQLLHWESLLSTQGHEESMLSDMRRAVRSLGRLEIGLVEVPEGQTEERCFRPLRVSMLPAAGVGGGGGGGSGGAGRGGGVRAAGGGVGAENGEVRIRVTIGFPADQMPAPRKYAVSLHRQAAGPDAAAAPEPARPQLVSQPGPHGLGSSGAGGGSGFGLVVGFCQGVAPGGGGALVVLRCKEGGAACRR